jgi:hypothetical protein
VTDDLPDVRKRQGWGPPSIGMVVMIAAWLGASWQELSRDLPDLRPALALGFLALLLGLMRWARS